MTLLSDQPQLCFSQEVPLASGEKLQQRPLSPRRCMWLGCVCLARGLRGRPGVRRGAAKAKCLGLCRLPP